MNPTTPDTDIITSPHALISDSTLDDAISLVPATLDSARTVKFPVRLAVKWLVIFSVLAIFTVLAVTGKLASLNLFTPGITL